MLDDIWEGWDDPRDDCPADGGLCVRRGRSVGLVSTGNTPAPRGRGLRRGCHHR